MNPQYFVCLAYFRWGHDVFSPFCQSSLPWSYGHIVKLDKNMMWTFWNVHFIGISPKFYIALKYDSEINVFFSFFFFPEVTNKPPELVHQDLEHQKSSSNVLIRLQVLTWFAWEGGYTDHYILRFVPENAMSPREGNFWNLCGCLYLKYLNAKGVLF